VLKADLETICDTFVAELDTVLGDDLVGVFQYGAAMFPPSSVTDFDAHVIVRRPFTDADRERVWAMKERLSTLVDPEDLDVWYVTLDAMRSHENPQTELKPGFTDDHWAIHRAHWHAGRFVVARGPDPRELVPEPTWEELDYSLQSALEEAAGERTDDLGAYGVLNLCRVLYSYEMRDVVTSKYHSALWTFGSLDAEHHQAIRDALDAYERKDPGAKVATHAFREVLLEKIGRARALAAV
jgi:hypothetical protein